MNKAYILRTCNPDMTSYNNFVWPTAGPVECPDWDPKPECGYGLHGLLNGQGRGNLVCAADDAMWLVAAVHADEVVDLQGKVKVPRAWVEFAGTRQDAIAYLAALVTEPGLIVYGTATAGDRGTATAGEYGTATAGYSGTATAGEYGTATAGDRGTATAGDRGTATAGDRGTATAGEYGTATAGYRGTATAGDRGTATAGDSGIIQISYWDDDAERRRIVTGYVGEDGIMPNVAYRLNNEHKLVKEKETCKKNSQ